MRISSGTPKHPIGLKLSLIHIFVKADIFEHPVSFAVESHANVGSPEAALSASLNKYGTVNLDYMREITDSTEMCIRDSTNVGYGM